MSPLLNPAPPWPRDPIVLLHGCLASDAQAILRHGIDPTKGRLDTDFGQGFYLTTHLRQARHWAWLRYYNLPPVLQTSSGGPVVVRFTLPMASFHGLDALVFVRGDYDYDDYWSLVQHCRQSSNTAPRNHRNNVDLRPTIANWYDVVFGPVATHWEQRSIMADSDQISFHTTGAASLLSALIPANVAVDPVHP